MRLGVYDHRLTRSFYNCHQSLILLAVYFYYIRITILQMPSSSTPYVYGEGRTTTVTRLLPREVPHPVEDVETRRLVIPEPRGSDRRPKETTTMFIVAYARLYQGTLFQKDECDRMDRKDFIDSLNRRISEVIQPFYVRRRRTWREVSDGDWLTIRQTLEASFPEMAKFDGSWALKWLCRRTWASRNRNTNRKRRSIC